MTNALSNYLDRRDLIYKRTPSYQNSDKKYKQNSQISEISIPRYPIINISIKEVEYPQIDRYEAEERAKSKMISRGFYRDEYDGGNG